MRGRKRQRKKWRKKPWKVLPVKHLPALICYWPYDEELPRLDKDGNKTKG